MSSLTPETATQVLTQLIQESNVFRGTLTSELLEQVADCIEAGADRQEIIYRLRKTRSLALLRLWGTILTRLEETDGTAASWVDPIEITELPEHDQARLNDVYEELIKDIPSIERFTLTIRSSPEQTISFSR